MGQHENDNTVDMKYEDLHAELEKYRKQERTKKSRRMFLMGMIVGVIVGVIMGTFYQRIIDAPDYTRSMHGYISLSQDKRLVQYAVFRPVDGAADPLDGATLLAYINYDKQEVSDLIKHLTKLRKQMH